jgi:hypothetical protein
MKFAHEFKEALQREGFPSRWVESAIPYSQLKKCIKKVENELRSFGLDAQTLALLIPHGEESRTNDNQRAGLESSLAFQYSFAGNSKQQILFDHRIRADSMLMKRKS